MKIIYAILFGALTTLTLETSALACAVEIKNGTLATLVSDDTSYAEQTRRLSHLLEHFFPNFGDWKAEFRAAAENFELEYYPFYIVWSFAEGKGIPLGTTDQAIQRRMQIALLEFGYANVEKWLPQALYRALWQHRYSQARPAPLFSSAMGQLRMLIISDPSRAAFPDPIPGIEAEDTEAIRGRYARSKIFGPEGISVIPDRLIHPLRREDYKVMRPPANP